MTKLNCPEHGVFLDCSFCPTCAGWEGPCTLDADEFDPKYVRIACKDCGVKTIPGPGSARCPSCWDDKCGGQ